MNKIERVLRKSMSRGVARVKGFYLLPMWSRLGPVGAYLARRRPMRRPPVLLISMPRSGSSWVGEVLGMSPTAAYLREPIMQSRKVRRPGDLTTFEMVPERLPVGSLADVASVADRAFSGVPNFPLRIVKHPAQWGYRERPRKRVVVKEVNLLALDWLLSRYDLRVIYLIRHPAAVANSYHRLGWARSHIEACFSEAFLSTLEESYRPFLSSFWAEHGALQALVHRFATAALEGYEHEGHEQLMVVKYEDLCVQPHRHFRRLCAFAGLEWSDMMAAHIEQRSRPSHHDRSDTYSTVRRSESMAAMWRREVPPEDLHTLREAYLHFDPPYYRSEWE